MGSCAAERQYRGDHAAVVATIEQLKREVILSDNNEYDVFVGIDWATESHTVCVLDRDRKVLAELDVLHDGAALAALADRLGKLAPVERIAVAIEIPRGPIVETMVERGMHVFALNPKQLDRFRDRHTVAGAKDDRRDALVLADSLRTDRHCFRHVRLDDPRVIELREVSRVSEDLKHEFNRMTNRLREQLHRFFPQVLQLSSAADEPWIWALLETATTPAAARKLKPKAVEKLLKEHRIRRVTARDLVDVLARTPLVVAPGTAEAASTHIKLLIPRLRLVQQQLKHCDAEMDRLLGELELADEGIEREQRDVHILRSLPGVGRVVAATLLAEASQPLGERDYQALRAHAGVAPVTHQSGKKRSVVMRQGCNGRLRNALYHWARVAAQYDASSKARYAALRAKGHGHARALRTLADRLLRILIAMLEARTTYDPDRRGQAPAGPATVAISAPVPA